MNSRLVPHLFRFHPRLLVAVVIGILAGLFVPLQQSAGAHVLLGWDVCVWSYLAMMWFLMATPQGKNVQQLAEEEDESAPLVLSIVSLAAIASVAAIVLVLATAKSGTSSHVSLGHLLFVGATLIGGWFLIPTIYALHYARLYFSDKHAPRALQFPDRDVDPDYWDFLYFSFTIAVASQTSDVGLASQRMRRAGLAQSVLAFFFNLAVLGLSINIAASLLG
ncbi:MAG: DUF1345 domain-containing protein [Janthinobacterium lividum]